MSNNLTFYHCQKCGKRLIARHENGIWKFMYGRFSGSFSKLVNPINENQIEIEVEDASFFKADLPFIVKVDREQMQVNKVNKNVLFVDRGYKNTSPSAHDSVRIREVIEYKKGSSVAAVEMEIIGSLRMRCIDASCRSWNTLNFFPNQDSESKTESPAVMKTTKEES